MQGFSFEPPKVILSFLVLACAYIVHAHIANRIGSPIKTFIIGRKSRISIDLHLFKRSKTLSRIATTKEFGDRVVFGEFFSLIITFLGILIGVDSFVDVVPGYSTKDLLANLFIVQVSIPPDQYLTFANVVSTTFTAIFTTALLTLTLFFYIINSDRRTDVQPDNQTQQLGAGDSSETSEAPKRSAEGAMKEKNSYRLPIPSVLEMRQNLQDPFFVSKMKSVKGFDDLKLTEVDIEEADLINEFLRPNKK